MLAISRPTPPTRPVRNLRVRASPHFRVVPLVFVTACLVVGAGSRAHPTDIPVDVQMQGFLESLPSGVRGRTRFAFEDPERFRFGWTPGRREGVRLDELDTGQRQLLEDFLRSVLSEAGARKVDAIIATEAALGVIENAPDYRNPGKYWTAVFGQPGPGPWAVRFEGHHLSVNLTFHSSEMVSATPLFLGANPERVPTGPDRGLRALAAEVDLGWALYESLDDAQRQVARGSEEWFAGFLTSPGERRPDLGKAAGITTGALDTGQQERLRRLIAAYVDTIAPDHAAPYLHALFADEWESLRFFWDGADERPGSYYYRIAGRRLLIEHDNRSGGTHVHAAWRDVETDFGATALAE